MSFNNSFAGKLVLAICVSWVLPLLTWLCMHETNEKIIRNASLYAAPDDGPMVYEMPNSSQMVSFMFNDQEIGVAQVEEINQSEFSTLIKRVKACEPGKVCKIDFSNDPIMNGEGGSIYRTLFTSQLLPYIREGRSFPKFSEEEFKRLLIIQEKDKWEKLLAFFGKEFDVDFLIMGANNELGKFSATPIQLSDRGLIDFYISCEKNADGYYVIRFADVGTAQVFQNYMIDFFTKRPKDIYRERGYSGSLQKPLSYTLAEDLKTNPARQIAAIKIAVKLGLMSLAKQLGAYGFDPSSTKFGTVNVWVQDANFIEQLKSVFKESKFDILEENGMIILHDTELETFKNRFPSYEGLFDNIPDSVSIALEVFGLIGLGLAKELFVKYPRLIGAVVNGNNDQFNKFSALPIYVPYEVRKLKLLDGAFESSELNPLKRDYLGHLVFFDISDFPKLEEFPDDFCRDFTELETLRLRNLPRVGSIGHNFCRNCPKLKFIDLTCFRGIESGEYIGYGFLFGSGVERIRMRASQREIFADDIESFKKAKTEEQRLKREVLTPDATPESVRQYILDTLQPTQEEINTANTKALSFEEGSLKLFRDLYNRVSEFKYAQFRKALQQAIEALKPTRNELKRFLDEGELSAKFQNDQIEIEFAKLNEAERKEKLDLLTALYVKITSNRGGVATSTEGNVRSLSLSDLERKLWGLAPTKIELDHYGCSDKYSADVEVYYDIASYKYFKFPKITNTYAQKYVELAQKIYGDIVTQRDKVSEAEKNLLLDKMLKEIYYRIVKEPTEDLTPFEKMSTLPEVDQGTLVLFERICKDIVFDRVSRGEIEVEPAYEVTIEIEG
ncbi:MAG: hypothetical protein H6850_01180 [Alphaproteobacteria bacterium]|nr:MAG: hypothetical protein H6850_01180 [Alphaproteobacteria bacterium]